MMAASMRVISCSRRRLLTRFLSELAVVQQCRCKNTVAEEPKYFKIDRSHEYKTLYPWKRREELASCLLESVIYNKDGLIAINKPYGVAVHNHHAQLKGEKNKKLVIETLAASDQGECGITIDDVLPILADKLRLSELHVVKATERYTSGVTLLTSAINVLDKVSAAARRARAVKVPFYSYWAVASSIPVSLAEKKQKVAIKIVEVPEHNQKAAIIDTRPSKNSVKNQIVKSAWVEYETAKVNERSKCSLVQISTTTTTWHFLRVYLAHKLAPVLGDALYSTRVKTVLGKSAAISPFNKSCYDPPTLSINLCNRLQLPPSFIPSIPTHLHLHRMTLVGYDKGQDVVLEALPPRHFLWTCKELDLSPDQEQQYQKLVA